MNAFESKHVDTLLRWLIGERRFQKPRTVILRKDALEAAMELAEKARLETHSDLTSQQVEEKWQEIYIRHRRTSADRQGFTLIELLVVIAIIALVVAAAGVIIGNRSRGQVSAAARLLQGALAGARDSAMHSGEPSGIRLLPDPAFPILYLANGQIDPAQPLACSRIIPIEPPPQYTTGHLTWVDPTTLLPAFLPGPCQVVKEQLVGSVELNEPTSWWWNIRLGDRLQVNGTGVWYTVVGPMVVGPTGGNAELFVNAGPPGNPSPFLDIQGGANVNPEYLFLVNGIDDNHNGWTDEGADGVDNNSNGTVDELAEWETEAWSGAVKPNDSKYSIRRRPGPSPGARELALPTNVVIDLTTWASSKERSRLPVNPYTGYVDILVSPTGSVVPVSIYSTPSAFGMDSAFFHFWLAERRDVMAPDLTETEAPYLPIGGIDQTLLTNTPYTGLQLGGEYSIVTLFARSGRILATAAAAFDNPVSTAGPMYNPGYPFRAAQQGAGGTN